MGQVDKTSADQSRKRWRLRRKSGRVPTRGNILKPVLMGFRDVDRNDERMKKAETTKKMTTIEEDKNSIFMA